MADDLRYLRKDLKDWNRALKYQQSLLRQANDRYEAADRKWKKATEPAEKRQLKRDADAKWNSARTHLHTIGDIQKKMADLAREIDRLERQSR